MSGTTISGLVLTPVTLSKTATQNPATVEGFSLVEAGITGTSAGYWTIQNQGLINGVVGVSLANGGIVTDSVLGAISGSTYGIVLGNGGTVDHGGVSQLQGGKEAIRVLGSAGTIVNSARIVGNYGSSIGVYLGAGGSVTNSATASIKADGAGIEVAGHAGTVINSGTISASNTSSGIGVFLKSGGTVTNAASASIAGGKIGVEGVSTLINSGAITGGIGVSLAASVSITNNASGSITGDTDGLSNGFPGQGLSGTIINQGSIVGTTDAGVRVFGASGSSPTVTITNSATGYIGGGTDGIIEGLGPNTTQIGTVINSGSIVGKSKYGVDLQHGSLTNASGGSIYGGIDGFRDLAAGGGTVSTLVNYGSIQGDTGAGADLANSSVVTNETGASIKGGAIGVSSAKLNIANYGSIEGSQSFGVGASLISLKNASGASISGGTDGVRVTPVNGTPSETINNAGRIIGTASDGIYLNSTGTVSNASGGYIYGGTAGVYVKSGAGEVVNSGAIFSTTRAGAGIDLRNGGVVTNNAFGQILGADGVYAEGASSTIINNGLIAYDGGPSLQRPLGQAIDLEAGGYVSNGASGRITGFSYGVHIHGDGLVINSGSIGARELVAGPALYLSDGGTVTNFASGYIYGGRTGVEVTGIPGAVSNYGKIGTSSNLSNSAGVYLQAGGFVVNAASASIFGATYGVKMGGVSNLLLNAGSITVLYESGYPSGVDVAFTDGGALTNLASGVIQGGDIAVDITGRAGAIQNYGTINGEVRLEKGGNVFNAAGGLIESSLAGIEMTAAGTVTNAGTIDGGSGQYSIDFVHAAGHVIVDPGAVFIGTVAGGAGASNTLELASGANAGTIGGLGSKYINFGTVIVDKSANWELTGSNTLAAGSTLTNNGTLTLSGATLSDASGVVNNGKIVLDPSSMSVASLTGTGTVTIDAGSTLAVQGAVSSGQDIVFSGSGAELDLAAPSNFSGTVTGFADGDVIDLVKIANVTGSHADMDYGTNLLTVTDGSKTYTFQFDKTESFAHDFFHLSASGGDTLIEESPVACYGRGTLIATETCEVPVEELSIGDLVMTASGVLRPIKWIGRRSYGGRFVIGRKDILPICFKAGSIGDNLPKRDLFISPHHAMYLDGVLIEAKDLVNGASIVLAENVEGVQYFHIEFDSHDVILAEGAASETFVDDDSRGMFHNAHEYALLYPNEAAGPTRYCGPRLDEGVALETVRRHLASRAGLVLGTPTATLRGYVDRVSKYSIEGWAQNTIHPDAPVCLDIYAGGRLIGQTLANLYREDLKNAHLGSGRHAFVFTLPDRPAISADTIEVRRSFDGAPLATRPAAAT